MGLIKLLPENLPPLFSFQTADLGALCCFTLRANIQEIARKYNASLKACEKSIEVMQERRTALISSAVTGKIDARHHG